MKNRLVTVTFECETSDEPHALRIIESTLNRWMTGAHRNQMVARYQIDPTTEETS
jgi:hypothetical protein